MAGRTDAGGKARLEAGLLLMQQPARQMTDEADTHCYSLNSGRVVSSMVAGFVSFLVATIMGISFGILVFSHVPGGVAIGVQMAILGVNIAGNSLLVVRAKLPCVVVTADNGVVAPITAGLVASLAQELSDPEELLATSIAGVAMCCAAFGLVQMLLVSLNLVRLVQYLPYSIPMGFLSGIGLELCSGVALAGCVEAQVVAATFAAALCLGSWWRGWPLSALFPVLLTVAIGAFYLVGAPRSWLLEIKEPPASGGGTSVVGLWSPSTLQKVQWGLLLEHGKYKLGTLCLLGCLQNCLFAGVFSRATGMKVSPNEVLKEFSQAFGVGGCLGLAGGFHNMACFSLSRELHSYRRVPGVIVAAMSVLLWITGLGPLLKVPRFVFAGLLLWVGLKFLRTYLWQPACMLPRSETAVIICVASIMKFGGFSMGVLVGMVLALVSMVGELASLSCVQLESFGDETRSNAVRSVRAEQLLHKHGREVMVLRLAPGFVFFATSAELVQIVEDELHVSSRPWQAQDPLVWESDSEDELDGPPPRSLAAVVIDFTLCRGFDGSLVGVLQQLASLGSEHDFTLHLAGLQSPQLNWLRLHTEQGVCFFYPDLDRALESTENTVLERAGMTTVKERKARCSSTSGMPRQLAQDEKGIADLESKGWALLLIYSDSSSASRVARPTVAQAMALLQGRCEFFEAPEESCPALAARFGAAPTLVLLYRGEVKWRHKFEKLVGKPSPKPQTRRAYSKAGPSKAGPSEMASPGGAGIGAIAPLPNAAAATIARDVEQKIREGEAAGQEGGPSDDVARKPSRRLVPKANSQVGWSLFLEMAGAASDGPLSKLADYVRGPKLVEKGAAVLRKGEAPGSVIFVGSGLLSLWNEGPGHDQDELVSPVMHTLSGSLRRRSKGSEDHRDMLSQGTSRLLRIGPGWVLGGFTGVDSSLRPPLVPLTCLAETEVEIFELAKEDAHRLHAEDPALMLALHELLTHFSGVLVRHMASQLSQWHSLLYAS